MSSKRSLSESASAVIEGNEDLLIEILVFLPPKSLVRLKLVSKRWRSLISAPSFCRRHTFHHLRRRRLPEPQINFLFGCLYSKYAVSNPTTRRSFPFTFPFGFSKMEILQSTNGLLLVKCEQEKEKEKEKEKERRYYVFNPTTLQQRDLSPLPCASVDSLYIIFDPSSSLHYRVVCFESQKKSTVFHLYDSETHKWNIGGKLDKRAKSFRNGVSFDGGIYFVRLGYASRFDLDGNLSKIPKAARHLSQWIRNKNYVMESNGFLACLTLSSGEESYNLLHVCEMEKGNENKWIEKYRDDMFLFVGDEDCIDYVDMMYMIRGENDEDSIMVMSLPHKIVTYRFSTGAYKSIVKFTDTYERDNPLLTITDAHHFVETLVPADLQPILSACGEQTCDIRLLGIIRGEKEQDDSLILSFLPRKKIVIYRFIDKAFEVDDYTGEEFLKDNPLWCVTDAYHLIHTLAPL